MSRLVVADGPNFRTLQVGTLEYLEAVFAEAQQPHASRILIDPRYQEAFGRELHEAVHTHADARIQRWFELAGDKQLTRNVRELLQRAFVDGVIIWQRNTWPRPTMLAHFTHALAPSIQRITMWTQRGAPFALIGPTRKEWLVEIPKDKIAELYLKFPSARPIQEAFVQRVGQGGVTKPEGAKSMTLARLGKIPNAELRRAVVTVFGLKSLGKPHQQDDYGKLYQLDERTNVVHVTCPSTGREYYLGVPADCETAREAVLWSFGLRSSPVTDGIAGTRDTDIGKLTEELRLLKEA